VAMLTGLLYDDALPLFRGYNRSNGLFPENVLEVLDDLHMSCHPVRLLPKRQPALVAIEWRKEGLNGHFVVWDPDRGQFLDPRHGLIDRRELLCLCRIEHIWSVGKRGMRRLAAARMAKAVAQGLFEPFSPAAVVLRVADDGFAIEVRFASDPPEEAHNILEVNNIPVHIIITTGKKGV